MRAARARMEQDDGSDDNGPGGRIRDRDGPGGRKREKERRGLRPFSYFFLPLFLLFFHRNFQKRKE